MDICFHITDSMYDLLYIEGYWVNMGYTKSWYINNQLIKGTVQNKKDWEKYVDEDVNCLRYGKWLPL